MTKYLPAILLALIFGLLIWQRFDAPPTLAVVLSEVEGESPYTLGETFKRGAVIESKDTFLRIAIGEDIQLGMGLNTQIELEDLTVDGPTIRLLKGRMYISAAETPIWVTTNTSENVISQASATLVNFDFLETVHVIPIEGTVQTSLKELNEYLLLPLPIAITEGYNPSYEPIEVDLASSAGAEFYQWLKLFQE